MIIIIIIIVVVVVVTIGSLPTSLVVHIEQTVRCMRLCASRVILKTFLTFEIDIWHAGSY